MRIITLAEATDNESRLIRTFITYPEVIVHIRKPTLSMEELKMFIHGFTVQERKKLVVHSYQEQSLTWGLERLHYPASSRPLSFTPRELEGYPRSTSVHDWATFNSLPQAYQDAFISPLFPSISKQDYQANETIRDTGKRSNFRTNLIALGGIDQDNIESLKQHFEDVALCGSVWLSPNPLVPFKTCYKLWYNNL